MVILRLRAAQYMRSSQPQDTTTACNARESFNERFYMSLLLLIILVLLLVGALPLWPHSTNWGYAPGGGLGLVLLIVVILIVIGRI